MTVLLVRHGETTWNVEGRVQGWTGAPLSGRGREQARTTGAYLAGVGVDRLVVSDLQRTQETARLFEDGGLDVDRTFEQGWRERNFGDYQAFDRTTVADRRPDFDPEGSLTAVETVPGGESLDEFVRRVAAACESVLADIDDGETVCVVTHGGPIRTVVADLTGRDMPSLAREWAPDNCSVTEIDPAEGTVLRRGDTSHLE